nr:hypothetical protein [Tanacetum cinerariifolium]
MVSCKGNLDIKQDTDQSVYESRENARNMITRGELKGFRFHDVTLAGSLGQKEQYRTGLQGMPVLFAYTSRLPSTEGTSGSVLQFNTIITSLKALVESFSSRNLVRKFIRALLTKWHPKVTTLEESKDLSTLPLDELIGNLKVYEVVLKKDSKAVKNKKEKAKEEKGKEERRCFKCGDPNHFISDCPKHSFNDKKAFVGGCWSDSEEEDDSMKDEICLMVLDNNEIESHSLKLAKFENSSYFLQEMIKKQRSQKDKKGLGFTEDRALTSEAKTKKLGQDSGKLSTVEPAEPVPSAREPASSNVGNQHSTEVRLKVKLEPDEWIKDSGCSRHMTGNKDLFSTYKAINGGNVVFGSNTKSKIIKKGQICDQKCKVLFSETDSEILKDGITIEDLKPIKTPMSSETKLSQEKDEESVDDTKHRGMIGSLLYLTASRSDIMFSVCLCARFQKDPKIHTLKRAATTVSAATTTTTTITIVDDITLAQALKEIKSTKPKEKGIVIQELGESTTTKSLQQSQDKERLAREKAKKVEEASIAIIETLDDIHAKIDVDHQLAERMQAQEQEEFFIAEKATLLQQLLKKRRKHFAAKRAKEKRNKPSTKAQQRKIMCTYLKNMEGYKLKDLKLKEFDSIQEMFDRAFKRVNTFEDFRTELVKGKEKRAGIELIQDTTKKQKVEDDKETIELKQFMEIIPDEEEVVIDDMPLSVKSPKIVD